MPKATMAVAASSGSSPGGARIGSQEPRARVAVGDVAATDGPNAGMLVGSMGLELPPWEHAVLDDWCAVGVRYRAAYSTCGLSVPCQNGKNAVVESFEAHRSAVCGWHALHTACRVKTVKKSLHRLVRYFTR